MFFFTPPQLFFCKFCRRFDILRTDHIATYGFHIRITIPESTALLFQLCDLLAVGFLKRSHLLSVLFFELCGMSFQQIVQFCPAQSELEL